MATAIDERQLRRQIDLALGICEERNAREDLELPDEVARYLWALYELAGRYDLSLPSTTLDAHIQLLALRRVWMPLADSETDDVLRYCLSCGAQLQPSCRRQRCTRCRREAAKQAVAS